MKPSRKAPSGTDDLFRSRLENIIDMRHQLVRFGLPKGDPNRNINTGGFSDHYPVSVVIEER